MSNKRTVSTKFIKLICEVVELCNLSESGGKRSVDPFKWLSCWKKTDKLKSDVEKASAKDWFVANLRMKDVGQSFEIGYEMGSQKMMWAGARLYGIVVNHNHCNEMSGECSVLEDMSQQLLRKEGQNLPGLKDPVRLTQKSKDCVRVIFGKKSKR